MSNYGVRWLSDKKTVVILEYHNGWTWEDTFNCTEMARDIIVSVPHDIYSIAHFVSAAFIPPHPTQHIRRVTTYYPPNVRGIIVVASNPILLETVKSQVEHPRSTMPYDYVQTFEEALRLLRNRGVAVD